MKYKMHNDQNPTTAKWPYEHKYTLEYFIINLKTLTFSELLLLEQQLLPLHPAYIETMYEALHKIYFSFMPKTQAISFKKHFEETLLTVLKDIKDRRNIDVSAETFFGIVTKQKELPRNQDPRSKNNKRFLQAIQYSYHFHTETLQEVPWKQRQIIHYTAFFFSITKNYASLELLFEKHYMRIREHSVLGPLGSALCFYATYGDLKQVTFFLKNDFSSNIYMHALESAIREKRLKVVKLLLRYVSDKLSVEDKEALLDCATYKEYPEIMQAILDAIGHLLSSMVKNKAFEKAQKKGALNIMMILLMHPCGYTIAKEYQGWALCHAASHGDLTTTEFLIKHKNQRKIFAQDKGQALWNASYYQSLPIVKCLLDHAGKSISPYFKKMAFEESKKKENLEILRLFITHPHGKIYKEHQEWALDFSACIGRLDMVQCLLNSSIYQEISPHSIGKAFCAAARNNNQGIVAFFTSTPTWKSIPVHYKGLALLEATTHQHGKIVLFLLESPIEIDIPSEYKNAAFTEAKKGGCPEIQIIFQKYFEKQNLSLLRLQKKRRIEPESPTSYSKFRKM